jgi:hypothetical protein
MIHDPEEFAKYSVVLNDPLRGYVIGHKTYYHIETTSEDNIAVEESVLFGNPPELEYFWKTWGHLTSR